MPDDADALALPLDAERVGRETRLPLRRAAGAESLPAFGDRDLVDPLAPPKRDVTEPEGEAAEEEDGDPLLDEQGAVRCDPGANVRPRKAERARVRRSRSEEGQAPERDGDEQRARAAQEKLTWGASRAAPSTSKYSRGLKLNMPAMTLVGTVSSAFSYESTVSL
jgi:hypothetical protein